jgi:hypothetical protein
MGMPVPQDRSQKKQLPENRQLYPERVKIVSQGNHTLKSYL